MAKHGFILQGHRGARGLKPENTLPAFEAALDAGANSVETDVQLSADGIAVLAHDACVAAHLYRRRRGSRSPHPRCTPPIGTLTFDQLRSYRAVIRPFPGSPPSYAAPTPVVCLFAADKSVDPLGIPRLADLFAFTAAYAGELGRRAGKSKAQRTAAKRIIFDLELKRCPFMPIDDFDGSGPGLLERAVAAEVRRAGVAQRTVLRSFDHRAVRAARQLLPEVTTAVLVANTAPVSPAAVARAASATLYCPDYLFLDEAQVREAQAAGVRVLPWTVNEPADWDTLLAWGVDGITTDFPDRLAKHLKHIQASRDRSRSP